MKKENLCMLVCCSSQTQPSAGSGEAQHEQLVELLRKVDDSAVIAGYFI